MPPSAQPDPVAAEAPLAEPQAPVAVPPPEEDLDAPITTGPAFSWTYALAVALAAGLVGILLMYRRRRNAAAKEVYQLVGGGAPAPVAPTPPARPVQRARPESPAAPAAEARLRDLPIAPERKVPEPVDEDPPAFLVRPAASAKAPDAEPQRASAPPHDGVVGVQLRPWLQLQFTPDRATATDTEASVQFELVIANTGNVVATNVRVDARMFNAGSRMDQEIEAYFAAPIPERSGGTIPAIEPRNAASLRSTVSMPKQLVREIEVNGRKLFIPTVAITVGYEWAGGGKSGRTSMSFLVGREPETPSSKMSPFRLDQGPRIYRQLGQRPGQQAVLV